MGLSERHRSIGTQNNEFGKPCEGANIETKACKAPCDKAVDCKLSDWHPCRLSCRPEVRT